MPSTRILMACPKMQSWSRPPVVRNIGIPSNIKCLSARLHAQTRTRSRESPKMHSLIEHEAFISTTKNHLSKYRNTMVPGHCEQIDTSCYAMSPLASDSVGFQLAAWGGNDSGKRHQGCAESPDTKSFQLSSPSWYHDSEDEEEHDDDDQDGNGDGQMQWAQTGNGRRADTIDEPDEMEGLIQNPVVSISTASKDRRVHFSATVVSEVRMFERCPPQYHNNLYYTAHELQKIIDDFVAHGQEPCAGRRP